MLTIYTGRLSKNTKKTLSFFQEHEIPYKQVITRHGVMTFENFKKLCSFTENVEELISSAWESKNEKKLQSLTLSELYVLIKHNYHLLKTPISVDYERERLYIGYNPEELMVFLDDERRKRKKQSMNFMDYSWYKK